MHHVHSKPQSIRALPQCERICMRIVRQLHTPDKLDKKTEA